MTDTAPSHHPILDTVMPLNPQQQQENAVSGPTTAPAGPQRQEYHFASSGPTAPSPITSKPLTVIFKGGSRTGEDTELHGDFDSADKSRR